MPSKRQRSGISGRQLYLDQFARMPHRSARRSQRPRKEDGTGRSPAIGYRRACPASAAIGQLGAPRGAWFFKPKMGFARGRQNSKRKGASGPAAFSTAAPEAPLGSLNPSNGAQRHWALYTAMHPSAQAPVPVPPSVTVEYESFAGKGT